MDVLEAIKSRKSIRAFKPDPVPRKTLIEILDVSQRSPSGTNTQPWRTWICTGEVKEAITRDVLAMLERGEGQAYHDYDYYPERWNDVHNARRRAVGYSLYALLGITKDDREGRKRQGARNFAFFDAPVGLFVTVDKYLARGNWADTGMYIQTIMLAAKGFGLDTCPQAAWIPLQKPIFHHLGIPDDQELVTGMSIGYRDTDAIENTLVSEREEIENVVHWRGFN